MLLDSSFYSTGVTHDNRYLPASYSYSTGHRCQDITKLIITLNKPSFTRSTIINKLEQIYNKVLRQGILTIWEVSAQLTSLYLLV
jgi:hypothetical protein